MNKKTIVGIIIAIIIIVVAIVGYFILGNNNSEETSNTNTRQSVANTNNENSSTDETNNTVSSNDTKNSGSNRILIAYFSETGNTEKFANIIHDQIGGDLFKIEPVTPYPEGDELFDYTREEQEEDRRPEIKDTVDMSQYDTVFIGYPIWWYEVPQIIKTFLDQYDLSGKTIIPFNTHGGSGLSNTVATITNKLPNSNVISNAFILSRNNMEQAPEEVTSWLEGIGY